MSGIVGPDIVESGLVLILDAANSKSYLGSGTTWSDLSGNNYNGTLINSPSYSSSSGGYLQMTGSSYISFSSYAQPVYNTTTSFTWNVWVYPFANAVGQIIMGNRGSDLDFTKLTTSNFEYYPTILLTSMPLNTWQNVCVVKDQTTLSYYRNSELVTSTTSSTTKPSKPFYIGGDPAPLEYSTARISHVSVYNRALTTSEIRQNFNAVKGRYSL